MPALAKFFLCNRRGAWLFSNGIGTRKREIDDVYFAARAAPSLQGAYGTIGELGQVVSSIRCRGSRITMGKEAAVCDHCKL